MVILVIEHLFACLVTESCHFICNVNATTTTGICGIACIGTGRCSYSCVIRVNVRCKTAVWLLACLTNCLLCLGSGATKVSGRIHNFRATNTNIPVVAFIVEHFGSCLVAKSCLTSTKLAFATVAVMDKNLVCLTACGSLCFPLAKGVTKSCYLICNVRIVATASVCCVTCIGTGGCSYCCIVRVNMRCKSAIRLSARLTYCLLFFSSCATKVSGRIHNFRATNANVPVVILIIENLFACLVTESYNILGLGFCVADGTCSALLTIFGAGSMSNNCPVTKIVLVYITVLKEIAVSLTATAGLIVISLLATVSRNKILIVCNFLIKCMKVCIINNNLNRRSYCALHRGNLYAAFLRSEGEYSASVSTDEILNLTICEGESKSSLVVSNVMAAYSQINEINSIAPIKLGIIAASYAIPCNVRECYIANARTGNKATKAEGGIFSI